MKYWHVNALGFVYPSVYWLTREEADQWCEAAIYAVGAAPGDGVISPVSWDPATVDYIRVGPSGLRALLLLSDRREALVEIAASVGVAESNLGTWLDAIDDTVTRQWRIGEAISRTHAKVMSLYRQGVVEPELVELPASSKILKGSFLLLKQVSASGLFNKELKTK